MKKSAGILLTCGSLFLMSVTLVYGSISVDVSNNGSDSQNTVAITTTATSEINQSNNTVVSNNISQQASSGSNAIVQNAGSDTAKITTGTDTLKTAGSTAVNNSTIVATDCCSSTQKISVSGNGSSSENTVNAITNSVSSTHVNQIALVNSAISQVGNSGDNHIISNGGAAEIQTGTVVGFDTTKTNLNQTNFRFPLSVTGDMTISVKDNAADSQNKISVNILNSFIFLKNDIADVNQRVYANLNSGRNYLSGNLNDVLIRTGDVNSVISVDNSPINTGSTEVLCCEDGTPVNPGHGGSSDDTPKNVPPAPPSTNTGSSSSSSGSGPSNNNSSIGGLVIGALAAVLPATGASALHFWIYAVIYLLMFLSGLYVRLRAGRSPDRRFAKRYF